MRAEFADWNLTLFIQLNHLLLHFSGIIFVRSSHVFLLCSDFLFFNEGIKNLHFWKRKESSWVNYILKIILYLLFLLLLDLYTLLWFLPLKIITLIFIAFFNFSFHWGLFLLLQKNIFFIDFLLRIYLLFSRSHWLTLNLEWFFEVLRFPSQ